MSKPVNDVRATSHDARYAGVVFSGSAKNAIKQAKAAPDYGLPDADLRAPKGMSRDRAALLGFLRLLGTSPLAQARGVPFSILSAEQADHDAPTNAAQTVRLRDRLADTGIQFAGVTGSYKGSREQSFAVITPTPVERMTVNALGAAFGQESVLHVDALRNAVLHYMEPSRPDVDTGIWS